MASCSLSALHEHALEREVAVRVAGRELDHAAQRGLGVGELAQVELHLGERAPGFDVRRRRRELRGQSGAICAFEDALEAPERDDVRARLAREDLVARLLAPCSASSCQSDARLAVVVRALERARELLLVVDVRAARAARPREARRARRRSCRARGTRRRAPTSARARGVIVVRMRFHVVIASACVAVLEVAIAEIDEVRRIVACRPARGA